MNGKSPRIDFEKLRAAKELQGTPIIDLSNNRELVTEMLNRLFKLGAIDRLKPPSPNMVERMVRFCNSILDYGEKQTKDEFTGVPKDNTILIITDGRLLELWDASEVTP
jgi:hypothetical protein